MIRNDRFSPELSGHGMHPERERGYRDGWNACSKHIERVLAGLRELRDAPAVDLRASFDLRGGEFHEVLK